MASDYLVKIDSIPAETPQGYIEIDSFSWGVTNTGSFAGGGAGSGKAQEIAFNFTKFSGEASPALFLACATGKHLKKVELFLQSPNQKPNQKFEYEIVLSDVLVSSYQTGGSANGAEVPMDQVSMNYSKIEFFVQGNKASFNFAANQGT